MEKIICEKCKNAYLQKNDEGYFCSSCGMFYSNAEENILLGVHHYKEGNFTEATDYLMKAIVNDGSNYFALLYKALIDGFTADEDTLSLNDVYEKIIFACELVKNEDFPKFLEAANDEAEKLEKALTLIHLNAFETADAEKIKSVVTIILKIQDEARSFRLKLKEFADKYSESNENSLVYNPSKCFLVTPEAAAEIGNRKFNKITSDIASHTVFTGILTTDIKNLEIYYRCIVMFFEKNKDKYDFLIEKSENFITLEGILSEGNYTSIQGTASTAEKLKITAYSFFEESLKGEEDAENEAEEQKSVILFKAEEDVLIPESEDADYISDSTEANDEASEETIVSDEEVIESADIEIEEVTDIEAQDDSVQVEEITEINEIANDTEIEEITESLTEEPQDFKDIPPQQTDVHAPILEADSVQDLPNTNVKIGDIFNNVQEQSDNSDSPFTYTPRKEANETDAPTEEEVDDAEVEQALQNEQQSKTKEFTPNIRELEIPEISPEEAEKIIEENENIAIKERYKKFKGVNTETEEFKSLAKKFDKSRRNDPNRETTLTPKKNNKPKIFAVIGIFILVVVAVNAVRFVPELIAKTNYNSALSHIENENYTEAIEIFEKLGDYQDSEKQIKECRYQNALLLIEAEQYDEAKLELDQIKGYNDDIETKINTCDYAIAKELLEDNMFEKAREAFTSLGNYGDSKDMVKECSYKEALSLIEKKKYEDAITILSKIKKYSDSSEKLNEAKYLYVTENLSADNKTTVKYLNELAKAKYRNSVDLKTELLGASSTSALKFFVNTSSTDLETSVEEVSHTKSAYFHIVALDKEYYGETLSVKYKTQYNFTWNDTVTFSENNQSAVVVYPPTSTAGYTVTFSITAPDGTSLGTQTIKIS